MRSTAPHSVKIHLSYVDIILCGLDRNPSSPHSLCVLRWSAVALVKDKKAKNRTSFGMRRFIDPLKPRTRTMNKPINGLNDRKESLFVFEAINNALSEEMIGGVIRRS